MMTSLSSFPDIRSLLIYINLNAFTISITAPDQLKFEQFHLNYYLITHQSILIIQSNFQIDGNLYKSVDQYYQSQKVKELTGIESKKFLDNSTKNYSGLARELLKQNGVWIFPSNLIHLQIISLFVINLLTYRFRVNKLISGEPPAVFL